MPHVVALAVEEKSQATQKYADVCRKTRTKAKAMFKATVRE